MDDETLISTMVLLLLAGHETTVRSDYQQHADALAPSPGVAEVARAP